MKRATYRIAVMVTLSLAAIILFALHPRQKVEAITCSDSLLTGVYGGYS